jgi:SMI1-KNR4 cell-wall
VSEVDMLLDRIRETRPSARFFVAGLQLEAAIKALEYAVDCCMPPSYRDFLARYGTIAIPGVQVSGITDGRPEVLNATAYARREWGVPDHLLVFEAYPEFPKCLDLSKRGMNGECPVVWFNVETKEVGPSAPSFGDWLLDVLRSTAGVDEEAERDAAPDQGHNNPKTSVAITIQVFHHGK